MNPWFTPQESEHSQMLYLHFMVLLHCNHGSLGFTATYFLDISLCLCVVFLPGLATAVKSLLWSKMAAPPLPRLPPLSHNLCDDDDSPPAFAAR